MTSKIPTVLSWIFLTVPGFLLKAQQPPRTPPAEYGTIKINYVRSWTAAVPITDANTMPAKPLREVKQSTQYLDGLGRPLQIVVRQGSLVTNPGDPFSSSSALDLIDPIVYDQYGREEYKYTPFASIATDNTKNNGLFKTNPFQQQAIFMQNQYGSQGEQYFYSNTVYEASPLNRVLKSFALGNSWMGSKGTDASTCIEWPDPVIPNLNHVQCISNERAVRFQYEVNRAIDGVRKWKVTDAGLGSFGSYNSSSVYPEGELFKNAVIDEHGKQVIEFKDKEGKLILKKTQLTAIADLGEGRDHTGWLCTYYVYDDFSRLRCVIQPRGIELISSTWALTDATILAEQCFRYEYDESGRMIIKKVPGAAEVYMVYDRWDRLILTQDGNMRPQNLWLFTKYDYLNRPIMTGYHYDGTNVGLLNIINHLKTNESWLGRFESFDASKPHKYTTTQSYPYTDNPTVHTVNYFDDYAWVNGSGLSGTLNSTYQSYLFSTYNSAPEFAQQLIQGQQVIGMPTGTKINVLGTSTYLYSSIIYDLKGRVIQVQSTNINNGTDIVTSQYNWSGQPLVTVQRQQTGQDEYIVVSKIKYDDLGRVVETRKAINSTVGGVSVSKPEQTIVKNEYDATGVLKKKKLAPTYNNDLGLETLTYDYNIRGWILGMNRPYAKDAANDNYFGFDLGYDKANNSIIGSQTYITPQFNGNISGMVWKSKGDGEKRKYDFKYDATNRLLKADFNQYNSSTFNKSAGVDFSVWMGDGQNPTSAYDANGNIRQMQQWGLKITGSSQIDNLEYAYHEYGKSNKLQMVSDGYNDPLSKLGDFHYPSSLDKNPVQLPVNPPLTAYPVDYIYDANGNLVSDRNKSITSITYNHLNLPLTIIVESKGTINYTYDAVGTKLKKSVIENNASVIHEQVSYSNVTITTTTIYIGTAVYESKQYSDGTLNAAIGYLNQLQFIGHEEGRARITTLPSGIRTWTYDYMLKDHLGNIRMLLTEEQKIDKYPVASFEDAKLSTEEDYYSIDPSYIEAASNVTGLPGYTNDNGIGNNPTDLSFEQANSTKLYKLNGNTNKTGLSITLKVMAGDKIDIFGKSYYFQNNTGGSSVNNLITVQELLTGLMGSPTGATSGRHTTATELSIISGVTNPLSGTYLSDPGRDNSTYLLRPRAYINYVFLDEQFRFASGGFSPVNNTTGLKDHFLELQNKIAPKNGYVYVFVSNESPVNVYFDNLQVVHSRSPILEETHYYPFGLVMSGISSKTLAFGGSENKHKFNGNELQNKEFSDLSGLEIYDFNTRILDPQIGRFWQIDPIQKHHESLYSAISNNPIWFSDPSGADTTLPTADGGIITLPNDVTSVETYEKNKEYILAGTNKRVPVLEGQLRSFKSDQFGTFTARWIDNEDEFYPEFSAYKNEKGQTYNQAVEEYNWGLKLDDFNHKVSTWFDDPANKALLIAAPVQMMNASMNSGSMSRGNPSVVRSQPGGLNLFKSGSLQATTGFGWRTGDRFLYLPNLGSPKLNWRQNSGRLRAEMRLGKPIFDNFLLPDGSLQPTRGFLNAERQLLKSHGWTFNPILRAWMPPI